MRQIDDGTIASRTRAINMWFEDFLEAVVRTATMKPLPTTQEIIFTGMSDAGDMLINLKVDEDKRANAYDRFLEEHAVVRGAPPAQDIEDLVDHMCFIIQRTVELRLGMRSLCAASSSPAHPSLHTRPTRAHGTPHTHARTRISATGLAGGLGVCRCGKLALGYRELTKAEVKRFHTAYMKEVEQQKLDKKGF